jgi:16S rRNA (guanine966-N2)-methyltransferase
MEPLREACMRYLAANLGGARVLDLFAGTGAIGLEALSRGAASVDFVENGTSAIHALKANVAKVKARDRVRIFIRDAIPFALALPEGAYDLAFADPPYGSKKLDRVVSTWLETPFSRVLVAEHEVGHDFGASTRVAHSIRAEDCVASILVAGLVPTSTTLEVLAIAPRKIQPRRR